MKSATQKRITALPRLFCARFFFFVRTYYGRIYSSCIECVSQRFPILRVVLRFCLGVFVWVSPLAVLRAEFSDDIDRGLLREIAADTKTSRNHLADIAWDAEDMAYYLNLMHYDANNTDISVSTIKDKVGTIQTTLTALQNAFGYGGGSSGTLKEAIADLITTVEGIKGSDLTNVESKLDSIITALNNLDSGGDSGITDSLSDIYNALGFPGGSGGSLKTYFDNIFPFAGSSINIYSVQFEDDTEKSPFPKSDYPWVKLAISSGNRTGSDFYSYLNDLFLYNSESMGKLAISLAKKQAWNDWQSHTNLVSTLYTLLSAPENQGKNPTFDAALGEIVMNDGEGSTGSTVYNISPVYTNDFASIETDSNNITNRLDFVSQSKIKSRYYSNDMLSGGSYQNYESISSSFSGIINIGEYSFLDMSSQFENYRKVISASTLHTLYNLFFYVWQFCAALSAWWVVSKIGGISKD